MKKLRFYLLLSFLFAIQPTTFAGNVIFSQNALDTTVELFVRSFQFLKGIKEKQREIKIGVLFNPSSRQSINDADRLVHTINHSPQAVKYRFKAVILSVEQLDKNAGFQFLYVTRKLKKYYQDIYKFSLDNRIFTVSNEKSCVVNKCCILSFETSNGPEIYLNQTHT